MYIRMEGLSKLFDGHGINELVLGVRDNEFLGLIGPANAGKTLTTRIICGLIKPDKGAAMINGLDCWLQSRMTHAWLGYLPVGFMHEAAGGIKLLTLLCGLRGVRDFSRRDALIDRLDAPVSTPLCELDARGLKKIALVAALMHDPAVMVLDSPAKYLDNAAAQQLMAILFEEKTRGKTVLITSSQFNDIDAALDGAAFLHNGYLIARESANTCRAAVRRQFDICVHSAADLQRLFRSKIPVLSHNGYQLRVGIHGNCGPLFAALAQCQVDKFNPVALPLTEEFADYYGGCA